MVVWLALISVIGVCILFLLAILIQLCVDDTGENKSCYKANKRAYKRKEKYVNLCGLKKCPLCLHSAVIYRHEDYYTPICLNESCLLHYTKDLSFETEEAARALWNSLHRSL